MNPLIESCLKITQCGISGTEEVVCPYRSKVLLNLGNFLVNGSNPERRLNLRFPSSVQTHWSSGHSVAIGFSGGIDSYMALHHALNQGFKKIYLVSVDYNQPYWNAEVNVQYALKSALNILDGSSSYAFSGQQEFAADLKHYEDVTKRIKMSTFSFRAELDSLKVDGWKNYIIPARNLLIAACCSEFSTRVWIIANSRKDETVGTPDKTTRFYRDTSDLFTHFYKQEYRVESPFFRFSKLEVVKHYLLEGGSIDALKHCFSCYTPVDINKPCGECYACFKRYKLFQALNVEVNFEKHPAEGKYWLEYQAAERAKGRAV